MNIGEVSTATGLPVKTVRYYADIKLVNPVARTDSGYRQYDNRALQKLIFIRRARAFGFSIEECRELLSLYEDTKRTAREVKLIAEKRLAEIESKQQEFQQLHNELSYLVKQCKGDEKLDCPIMDTLGK